MIGLCFIRVSLEENGKGRGQGDHLGAYYKIQLKDDGGWDQTAVEMVKCSQYLQSEATRASSERTCEGKE